jgi:hypothetical protein
MAVARGRLVRQALRRPRANAVTGPDRRNRISTARILPLVPGERTGFFSSPLAGGAGHVNGWDERGIPASFIAVIARPGARRPVHADELSGPAAPGPA